MRNLSSRVLKNLRRHVVTIGAFVIVALALATGYAGWLLLEHERESACVACGRPLGAHTRTVGVVEGEEKLFCCPTCAVLTRRQTRREVEVTELTDHISHDPLEPEDSFLVVGSRVNHCLREEAMLTEHKETSRLGFDRCSPGILAFSSKDAAVKFISENGGELMQLAEVEEALR